MGIHLIISPPLHPLLTRSYYRIPNGPSDQDGHSFPCRLPLLTPSAHPRHMDKWSLRRGLLLFWSVCSRSKGDNCLQMLNIFVIQKEREKKKIKREKFCLVDGNMGSTDGEKYQWGKSWWQWRRGVHQYYRVCLTGWTGRNRRRMTSALAGPSEAAQHIHNGPIYRVRNSR